MIKLIFQGEKLYYIYKNDIIIIKYNYLNNIN